MFILDSVTLADESVGKTQSEYLPYPFEQQTMPAIPKNRLTKFSCVALGKANPLRNFRQIP